MNIGEHISIVLVEPQSPGNVGMVCRAMKNFGLSDLRLVNPCPLDHLDAIKFSLSAKDILSNARCFKSLSEAIADSPISIATTRRLGKYRQEIYSPTEIVQKIESSFQNNRVAIVFGREDSGLTTDEVSQCRWQSAIVTSYEYGSLNLAQAVLVFCYELSKTFLDRKNEPSRTIAPTEELEPLYTQMEQVLLKIGFINPENPAHIMRSFRRIFARAELDSREISILRGMFSQTDWAVDRYEGKKGR